MELRASVVSSVALRPSTVYVLRVEAARRVWHVRRCFADFCELRDKLLAAATATASASAFTASAGGRRRSGVIDSPASASSESSGCSSGSPARSATRSPLTGNQRPEADVDGLAFLLDEFPTRRRFWSRSGKLVRRRAAVLDTFLQQALQFMRDVHARGQIAVYFSVKMHLEQFLETSKHPEMYYDGMLECSSPEAGNLPRPTLNQYPVASKGSRDCPRAGDHKQSRWRCAADRWRSTNESDSGSESDAEIDRAIIYQIDRCTKTFAASSSSSTVQASSEDDVDEELLIVGLNQAGISRQFRPRHSVFHPSDNEDERENNIDDDSDLYQSLRKAASAVMPRETREMRLHYTGSHYAPMQSGGDSVSSASAAWAARVEIAGIRPMISKPVLVHPQDSQHKTAEPELRKQPLRLQQRPRDRHAARQPECA